MVLGKSEGTRLLERTTRTWDENIKMDLKKIE